MTTYYELLGVSPDASDEEIRAAYAEQYSPLRQIAEYHHDRAKRFEAEQQIRELEKAIAVLTDPVKRVEYDMRLGSSRRGGLVDPDAPMPDIPPGPMLSTPPRTPPAPENVRVDAWVCPKCQHPNPIGTRYCQKCREQIGVDCPNCGTMVQATARFCPNCGIEIKSALEEQERERERQLRRQMEQRLVELRRQLREYQKERDELQSLYNRKLAPLTNGGLWGNYKPGCGFTLLMLVVFFFSFSLITSMFISSFQKLVEGSVVVACITPPLIMVLILTPISFLRMENAKPRIAADLEALDDKMEKLRNEIDKIKKSSIH